MNRGWGKTRADRNQPGHGSFRSPQARHHPKLFSQTTSRCHRTFPRLDSYCLISSSRNQLIASSVPTLDLPHDRRQTDTAAGDPRNQSVQPAARHKCAFLTPQKLGKDLPTLPEENSANCGGSFDQRANRPPVILRCGQDRTFHVFCNPAHSPRAPTNFSSAIQCFRLKPLSTVVVPHKLDVHGGGRHVTTDVDSGRAFVGTNVAASIARDPSQWYASGEIEKQQIVTELSDYAGDFSAVQPIPYFPEPVGERLDVDHINDGIVYVNGGIGVRKPESVPISTKSRKVSRMRTLQLSSFRRRALDPELAAVRSDILDRRSRLTYHNEVLEAVCSPELKHENSWLIKIQGQREESEDVIEEAEGTPTENVRRHTLADECTPSHERAMKMAKEREQNRMVSWYTETGQERWLPEMESASQRQGGDGGVSTDRQS